MRVPASLQHEHDNLHTELDAASRLPNRTGEAARQVVRIMQPHFIREQEYATPPLGLLQRIAGGKVTPTMAGVLPLTDRLRTELPLMLEEHRAIVGALNHLATAAREERHEDVARFAERLMLHAQLEEEILYPAAMLVGEYVKLRLSTTTDAGEI